MKMCADKKPKIVTFSGKARSGKNTASAYFKKKLESTGHRVIEIAYADHVKYIAKQYFNWNGEKDESGRTLLQTLGEAVRKKDEDYWVRHVVHIINNFFCDSDFILITDARYPNEISYLKDSHYDIITIEVIRPSYQNDLSAEQLNHSSETSLDGYAYDITLSAHNVSELYAEIDKIFEKGEYNDWIY